MATDWVTEQLRKAFIKINAKAEREAQKEKKRKKSLNTKARAMAAASAAKWAEAQSTRPCCVCGKPTNADPEFFLNPVMCRRCMERSQNIDLGIHPRKPEDYSEIKIVKGGAPGLGKRK